MNKNRVVIISLLIVVAAVAVILVMPRLEEETKALQSLPTKDNPSPSGLYSNVPPFEEWEWVERRKEEEERIAYRVKLPPTDEYIEGPVDFRGLWRNLDIYIYKINHAAKNINELSEINKEFFSTKFRQRVPLSNIGRFYTITLKEKGGIFDKYLQHILVPEGVVIIRYDFDTCQTLEKWVPPREDLIALCREYFQIYLPIVEKALSTLEIPDYLDDRGFSTSTEIKLLPDELRIYEVR